MNARIGLFFVLLTFLISPLCLADATTAGASKSTATNLTQSPPGINIGPFYSPGPAKDNQTDWLTPLLTSVFGLLKTFLWVGLIFWFVRAFKNQIGDLIEKKLKSIKILGSEAAFDTAIANQQRSAATSTPDTLAGLTGTTPATETTTTAAPATETPATTVPATETPTGTFALTNEAVGDPRNAEFEKQKNAYQLTGTQRAILKQLENNVAANPEGFTPEQRIQLGARALAQLYTTADFWRIYALIYGSQIEFLQRANSAPVNEADTVSHWLAVQQKFPALAERATMKQYLIFLLDHGLLEYRDEMYLITEKGREFLLWCVNTGLPLARVF